MNTAKLVVVKLKNEFNIIKNNALLLYYVHLHTILSAFLIQFIPWMNVNQF
jgi:hypothetical protein